MTNPDQKAAEAGRKAQSLLDAAQPARADHPYAARKQIALPATVHEIVQADAKKVLGYAPKSNEEPLQGRLLVVPVCIDDGTLSTVELIDESGRKSALAGGRKGGGFWSTSDLPDCDWTADLTIIVGEGMATVVSASMATRHLGVAALSCGNLLAVGKMIRERYPDAKIVFVADLGIGVKKSTEAALAVGGCVAIPTFPEGAEGKDANDLHVLRGLPAVAACIEGATKPGQGAPVTADATIPVGEYRFSESEAARRLGDIIRDCARFAADERVWYFHDGKHWTKDHGGVLLLERSLAVSRAYAEDAIRHGSGDAHFGFRMATAKTYNGLPGRKRLIELAKAEPGLAILSSQFDADPWLFNVENGTIDLRAGKLRVHDPADLLTKLAPVKYDPAATCEPWASFLAEVIPDAEARTYFQRVVGYCLTGDVTEHKLFFCYGTGANGKSVVLEVLLALLGDHATLAPVSLLMAKPTEQHPCDRMVLRGRRLAVFAETPAGKRWDESTVKALTGGDTITARGMHENFSTFKPSAKFAIAGNHRPSVNDLTEGFWRRFEEIPFEVTIPEDRRDPKLADKLRAELPGILVWALEGCAAWQREGLGKSVKVQTATGAYRAESDRLAPFLAERCELAPGNRVSNAALRAAYEAWCSGEREHPINSRDFAEQLRQRGVVAKNVYDAGKSVRGWHGIALREHGHMDTSVQQFPVSRLEEFSRETTRKVMSIPVHLSMSADAPDPMAQLGHCLRVKPDTMASEDERRALVSYCDALPATEIQPALEHLFDYWRKEPAPSVTAWLAKQRGPRQAELAQ